MADSRKAPDELEVYQTSSTSGTSRDGIAAYGNDSATSGSPLWGFRQYCRTITELHNAAEAVKKAASRAVNRAHKLAEAAEQDDQPLTTWVVQRFDNVPAPRAIGYTYDTTLAADIDCLLAATANLASAVSDVCEITQIGG